MSRTDPTLVSNRTLHLPDGRILGYADYGPGEGTPLFYFHGYPGARLEAGFLAQAAVQAGVRLIGVDRPGMGLSSFQAGRRLLDWPDDVATLASHLAIERFAVAGFSGGGPYALACAYKIPDRLTACGIVAGIAPPNYDQAGMMARNRVILFLACRHPWLLLPLMLAMGRVSDAFEWNNQAGGEGQEASDTLEGCKNSSALLLEQKGWNHRLDFPAPTLRRCMETSDTLPRTSTRLWMVTRSRKSGGAVS